MTDETSIANIHVFYVRSFPRLSILDHHYSFWKMEEVTRFDWLFLRFLF